MKRLKGSYELVIGNYDWGCAVNKAIVSLNEKIDHISAAELVVTEHKMVTEEETPEFDIHEEYRVRTITDVYLCDKEGRQVQDASTYFAIEMTVGPTCGSPLVCQGKHGIFRWSDPYELIIEADSMDIEKEFTGKKTAADRFPMDSYTSSSSVKYDYCYYDPENETDLLLVWLHGLGEGQEKGSNAHLPVLGHKGTSLADEAFQKAMGGAHILVPQCPTYWMDGDGKATNFGERLINANSSSYYTESLEEMIDWYAERIGAKRILLAGCSNGGFMSMLLGMSRPERYLGAVPICEAVPDEAITDDQISQLLKLPLYFIYCIKDPIVNPKIHEIPTIRRLRDAGHKHLMVYESQKVVDTTGNYKDGDGQPYEYMSHLSWIHFDNDEDENGEKLGVYEWMRKAADGEL